VRTAGPERSKFAKDDGKAAKPNAKKYHAKKFALVILAVHPLLNLQPTTRHISPQVFRLKKIMERKKLIIKQELEDEMRVCAGCWRCSRPSILRHPHPHRPYCLILSKPFLHRFSVTDFH
jgi:hypothetical protein